MNFIYDLLESYRSIWGQSSEEQFNFFITSILLAVLIIGLITILLFLFSKYILLPVFYNLIAIIIGTTPYYFVIITIKYWDYLENFWKHQINITKFLIILYFLAYLIFFYFFLKDIFSNVNNKKSLLKIPQKHIFTVWIFLSTFFHLTFISNLAFEQKIIFQKYDYILLGYVFFMLLTKVIVNRNKSFFYFSNILRKIKIIISSIVAYTNSIFKYIKLQYDNYLEKKYYVRNTLNKNYFDIQYSFEQKQLYEKLAKESKTKWEQIENARKEALSKKIEYENQIKYFETSIQKMKRKFDNTQKKVKKIEAELKNLEAKKSIAEKKITNFYRKILEGDVLLDFLIDGQMNKSRALKILQINEPYSLEELEKVYLDKIKKNHPDKLGNVSDELKIFANELTKAINLAYDELKRNYSH